MTKVLVTGGAGFIGSNLCNILSSRGYSMTAFDDLSLGWRENLDPKIEFVGGSTSSKSDLEKAGSADCIVHLAGSSSAPMFIESLRPSMHNSIDGFLNVLQYATAIGARKVVFASTSSIYGNTPLPHVEDGLVQPGNYYAISKWCMEELSRVYAAENGLQIIALRFMSIYGLHEEHKGRLANLVSQFAWGIEDGKAPVIYGDGEQTRDFTSVRDAVDAIELAIRHDGEAGLDIFNVGTGRQTSVNELVQLLINIMNAPINPTLIPNPVKKGYIRTQCADLSKVREILKFEARVSLEDGITELLNHRVANKTKPVSLSF